MSAAEGLDQGTMTFPPQQSTDSNRPAGPGRTSLQRRVQNALRWRSWGGEADTAANIQQQRGNSSALGNRVPSDAQRNRGRSVGSDVELSALPSTSSIGSGDGLLLSTSAANTASGNDLAHSSSAFGSTRSSTSLTGARPASPNSTLAGQQQPQQQGGVMAGASSAAADETCSIATQAGSRAHSFTSLYSMLEQGDYSEAGGSSTLAAAAAGASHPAAGGGAVSPYRGSDAGVDIATSVSTLPFISEAAYDEQQQLLEVDELSDAGRVSGFDDPQGSEREGCSIPSAATGPTSDNLSVLRMGAMGIANSSQLRMSSSIGGASINSNTSGASDTSTAAGAGFSAPGSVSSNIAAPLGRLPSPAGSGVITSSITGSGAGNYGRSGGHGSQRGSGSRHTSHHAQQQQQLGGTAQQQEGNSLRDLPQPFSTRKRPENDETCSYATQAGSVHSVSSILSSAFIDNTAQRGAASGQQQQQQRQQQALFIHPLTVPDTALTGCEESAEDDDTDFASEIDRAEVASATTTAAATVGGEGWSRRGSVLGSPVSSCSGSQRQQQQGGAGHRCSSDLIDLRQQQLGGSISSTAPQPAAGSLERKGSLKGAFRSVVAWGSGLGQRLQRAGGSGVHQPAAAHRQHGRAQAAAGGGHELASM